MWLIYVNMQNNNENLQHNYVAMQHNLSHVNIIFWNVDIHVGTVHTNAGSCDPSEDEISEGYKEFIGKKAIEDLSTK